MNRNPLFGADAPLIAILRGVEPAAVCEIAGALLDTGVRWIEVPLNSPAPFASIERLVAEFGTRAVVGAGTVTRVDEVDRLADSGARLCVSPHCDAALVAHAKARGLLAIPGVMTPTEAFAALRAGADAIKLFPMEVIGARGVRALKAVLPPGTACIGVGGIGAGDIGALRQAGCDGFGLGSWLYKPGDAAAAVRARAGEAVAAV
jgi:2-dehydro-3-deoxyphosphogalactonate aldolase